MAGINKQFMKMINMKFAVTLLTSVMTLLMASDVSAKNDNTDNDGGTVTAKVWFKDGRVYEGPLLKHWRTYSQTFLSPAHKFQTRSEANGKSVKCDARETDSILITGSAHPDFRTGDFYVSFSGKTNVMGGRAIHKMLKREHAGKNVDFCKLPYTGNCVRAGANMDQRMELWLVRFRNTGYAAVFFDNPLENGCNAPVCEWGGKEMRKRFPELAEAIDARFSPDKHTRSESIMAIWENPMIYIDFIDRYLDK